MYVVIFVLLLFVCFLFMMRFDNKVAILSTKLTNMYKNNNMWFVKLSMHNCRT